MPEQLLLEDGTPLLAEDGSYLYLETGDLEIPVTPELPPVASWSIDLCRRWVKIAEVDGYTFGGIERDNKPGEWSLEVAPASISEWSTSGVVDDDGIEGVYGPADVDSVILWRDDELAFPGLVKKVSEGVGGFEHIRDGDTETYRWSGPDLWGVLHEALSFPDPEIDPIFAVEPVTLTTSAAADDIVDTTDPHWFIVDQPVTFPTLTGGAGLTAATTYYVIAANLSAQTFQVATTVGGTAVNFTTNITAGTVQAVPVTWSTTHDVRTGVASSVLAGYIHDNLSADALIADRRYPGLTVTDEVVGVTDEFSVRLQYLDEVASRLATDGGFRCRLTLDADLNVVVILDAPNDLTSSVVISDQGDLANVALRRIPRSADWVLTGGQGEGTAREFRIAETTPAFGRRIETFNDQSSLSTVTELLLSAQSVLRFGAASWSIDAEVTDNLARTLRYGRDLRVGDRITIEVDGVRYPVPITSAVYEINAERQQVRPQLGTGVPDALVGLIRDVANLAARFDRDIS